MSIGRATPGQMLKLPPADVWNAMIDAGLWFRQQQRVGVSSSHVQIPTDLIRLKNNTGAAVVAGRALEVGTKLPTNVSRESLWFDGDTPAPDGSDVIAVTLRQMPSTAIDLCQVSGVAFVKLNVNHVQQHYCDVDSGSTLLQSKWHGRGEILWKSTASTGEQDAVIRLGSMFRGPIKGAVAGGLARGSSATTTVYWGGSAASPSSTVTVYWNWMDGGPTDVPANGEILFGWHPDEQKYVLWNAECEHA